MMSSMRLRIAVRAALALTLAVVLSACDNNGGAGTTNSGASAGAASALSGVTGTDITGTGFGKNVELLDHNGKQINLLDAYRGKVLVVFFGFTQCPDVCPTTMAELAQVKEKLEPQARDLVQVVMISVDPQRDTPQVLKQYVAAFDPSFMGLTGSDDQIAKAASSFKAYYKKVDSGKSYTMEHSSGLYVIDTKGESRLLFKPNTPPEDIAADLQKLL